MDIPSELNKKGPYKIHQEIPSNINRGMRSEKKFSSDFYKRFFLKRSQGILGSFFIAKEFVTDSYAGFLPITPKFEYEQVLQS